MGTQGRCAPSALRLRETVLRLRRQLLGPEHPDTLIAMKKLALSYDTAGLEDEADELREEVKAVLLKKNGQTITPTASTR